MYLSRLAYKVTVEIEIMENKVSYSSFQENTTLFPSSPDDLNAEKKPTAVWIEEVQKEGQAGKHRQEDKVWQLGQ